MSMIFDRDHRKSNPRFIAFAVLFGRILNPKDMEMSLDAAGTKIKRPQTLLIQQSKIITGLIWLVLCLGSMTGASNRNFGR